MLWMGVYCYIVYMFLDLHLRNWNLFISFKSKWLHCYVVFLGKTIETRGKLISFATKPDEVPSLNLPIFLEFLGVFCGVICSLSPLYIVD